MTQVSLREPTFLILTALAAGAQHGYGIMTDVTRISGGRVRLRAGIGYAVHNPPMPTGAATVVLPPITRNMPDPAVVADSEPVLSMALRQAGLDMSVQNLRSRAARKPVCQEPLRPGSWPSDFRTPGP